MGEPVTCSNNFPNCGGGVHQVRTVHASQCACAVVNKYEREIEMIEFLKVHSVPTSGKWAVWQVRPSSTIDEIMTECGCDEPSAHAALKVAVDDDHRTRADERKRICEGIHAGAMAVVANPNMSAIDGLIVAGWFEVTKIILFSCACLAVNIAIFITISR